MWTKVLLGIIVFLAGVIIGVVYARADDHRIHPECVEANDVNGKPYRSCSVPHPDTGQRLAPVQRLQAPVQPLPQQAPPTRREVGPPPVYNTDLNQPNVPGNSQQMPLRFNPAFGFSPFVIHLGPFHIWVRP